MKKITILTKTEVLTECWGQFSAVDISCLKNSSWFCSSPVFTFVCTGRNRAEVVCKWCFVSIMCVRAYTGSSTEMCLECRVPLHPRDFGGSVSVWAGASSVFSSTCLVLSVVLYWQWYCLWHVFFLLTAELFVYSGFRAWILPFKTLFVFKICFLPHLSYTTEHCLQHFTLSFLWTWLYIRDVMNN